MRRITQWDKAPRSAERLADLWRVKLPVPRFLRNSPLRTMRERICFVLAREPKVHVNFNVSNTSLNYSRHTALATTLAHYRFASNTTTIHSPGQTTPSASTLRPAPRAAMTAPLALRPILTRAMMPMPDASAATQVAGNPPQHPRYETPLLNLPRHARRVHDLIPATPTHVVKRATPAITTNPASSMSDLPGIPSFPRTVPDWKPDFGTAPSTPPQVNVEHLTDQVLRQLDRRLIASRERFGKI